METPSKKNEAMSKSPRSGRKASKKENVMKNVFAILAISAISLIGSTAFAAVPVACDPNEQSTGAIIMAFDKAKDCTPTSYEKLKADLATKNCKVTDLPSAWFDSICPNGVVSAKPEEKEFPKELLFPKAQRYTEQVKEWNKFCGDQYGYFSTASDIFNKPDNFHAALTPFPQTGSEEMQKCLTKIGPEVQELKSEFLQHFVNAKCTVVNDKAEIDKAQKALDDANTAIAAVDPEDPDAVADAKKKLADAKAKREGYNATPPKTQDCQNREMTFARMVSEFRKALPPDVQKKSEKWCTTPDANAKVEDRVLQASACYFSMPESVTGFDNETAPYPLRNVTVFESKASTPLKNGMPATVKQRGKPDVNGPIESASADKVVVGGVTVTNADLSAGKYRLQVSTCSSVTGPLAREFRFPVMVGLTLFSAFDFAGTRGVRNASGHFGLLEVDLVWEPHEKFWVAPHAVVGGGAIAGINPGGNNIPNQGSTPFKDRAVWAVAAGVNVGSNFGIFSPYLVGEVFAHPVGWVVGMGTLIHTKDSGAFDVSLRVTGLDTEVPAANRSQLIAMLGGGLTLGWKW